MGGLHVLPEVSMGGLHVHPQRVLAPLQIQPMLQVMNTTNATSYVLQGVRKILLHHRLFSQVFIVLAQA